MIAPRLTLASAAMLAALCLAAGRADVWNFWAWVGVVWLSAVVTFTALRVRWRVVPFVF